MKKQITTIALGILLLSFASAMYAGTCEELDVSGFSSLDNIVYSVAGNSSDLEGLNISIVNSSIEICTVVNYKPDNFTLIFFDNSTQEKEVIVYRSGRSRTKKIYKNITEYVEVEKVIYEDKIIIKEINATEDEKAAEEEVIEQETSLEKAKMPILVIGCILLAMLIIYLIFSKDNKEVINGTQNIN